MIRFVFCAMIAMAIFFACEAADESSENNDDQTDDDTAGDDDDNDDNDDNDNDDTNDDDYSPPDEEFPVASDNVGWIVGWDARTYQGLVFHVQDGIIFRDDLPDPGVEFTLYAVSFPTADEGWAAGVVINERSSDRGLLFHYQHGVWLLEELPDLNEAWKLYDIYMIDNEEGWIAGHKLTKSFFLHLIEGEWKKVEVDLPGSWIISKLHFLSDRFGYAAGYYYDPNGGQTSGLLLKYDGADWQEENLALPDPAPTYWSLSSVLFISEEEGWAVGGYAGGDPVLFHFTNGNWEFAPLEGYSYPHMTGPAADLSFLDPNNGWLVAEDRITARYQDGEWYDRSLPYSFFPGNDPIPTVDSVSMTSAQEAWSGGWVDDVAGERFYNYGLLLHFVNDAWESIKLPSADYTFKSNWWLTDLDFLPAE